VAYVWEKVHQAYKQKARPGVDEDGPSVNLMKRGLVVVTYFPQSA